MPSTNNQDHGQYSGILGWLYIAVSSLLLLAGVFVLVLLFLLGYLTAAPEPLAILGGLGLFLGGLIILLALLGILAGIGLLKCSSWGHRLAIVVAILLLICFPIGTVVGIFALALLLRVDGEDACCRPARAAVQEEARS